MDAQQIAAIAYMALAALYMGFVVKRRFTGGGREGSALKFALAWAALFIGLAWLADQFGLRLR